MVQKSSPGRPLGFRPDEAVAGAMDAFWRHGYEATTLGDLEAATGLARSSLYNTFGGKRDLFVACLAAYAARTGDGLLGPMEGGRRGLDDVAAFLDAIEAHVRGDGRPAGCLVVNSLVEVGGRDPAVDAALEAYTTRLGSALGAALGRAAGLGEIDGALVGRRAALLTTLVIGVSAACRVVEAVALLAATRAQLDEWRL